LKPPAQTQSLKESQSFAFSRKEAPMHPIILPGGAPLWAEILITVLVLAGVWVSLRAFFRNRE
jgi:hypothetical protein